MTLELNNQFKYELTFIWASVCSLLALLLCCSSNKKQQASNTSMLKGSSVMERPSGEAIQTLTPPLANKPLKLFKKSDMSPEVNPKRQEGTSLDTKSLPSFPEPVNPEFLLRQPCPDSRSGFSDFSDGATNDKAPAKDGAVAKQPDGKPSLSATKSAQVSKEKEFKGEQKKAKEDRDHPVKLAVVKRGPTVLSPKISKYTMKQLENMLTSFDDVPITKSTLKSSLKLAAKENVIKNLEGGNLNKQGKRIENKENFGDRKTDERKLKDEVIGKDGKRRDELMGKDAVKLKNENIEKFGIMVKDERMGKYGNMGKVEDDMGKNVGIRKYGYMGKDEIKGKYEAKEKYDIKGKDEFIRKDDFMRNDADKGKCKDIEKIGGKAKDECVDKYGNRGKVEDIGMDAGIKNEVMEKYVGKGKYEGRGKNEETGKDVGMGRYGCKEKNEGMGKGIDIAKFGDKGKEEGLGKHVDMEIKYLGMKNDENIRKNERLRENEGIARNDDMRKNEHMGKNEAMRKNEGMVKNEGVRKNEGMTKQGSKVKIEGKIRTMGKQEYHGKR